MKKRFLSARILSGLLFVTGCASECLAQRPGVVPTPSRLAGGWAAVAVTNHEVVAAASFALSTEERALQRTGFLRLPAQATLVKIVNAQEQVVAGLNVRLCMQVHVNGTTKEAAAVVFCALSGKCELTSWNWGITIFEPPSGIVGRVDERRMSDTWNVDIFSDRGDRIACLQTDRNGAFSVDLEPGDYVLTPTLYPRLPPPGQVSPMYVLAGPSTPVKVVAYRMTYVVLPISIALASRSVLQESGASAAGADTNK